MAYRASGLLVGLALTAGLAVLAIALTAASGGAGGGSTTKLLIVADEWEPMNVLAEFLRAQAKREVLCVEQKDLPADLAGCEAVFMYIHGKMTSQTEKALIAYANGGGRLIVLHHGIASGKVRNPAWMRLTGIHIAPRNDPNYPWKVLGNTTHTLVNLQPRHYITSNGVEYDRTVEYLSSDAPAVPTKLPALDLENTEVFLNQHFTDGREKTVLFGFRAVTPGGKVIMQDRSGWYKPAGAGWVFYLQPGHCAADFRNAGYRQIILNCLTWRPDMPLCAKPARVK